MNFLSHASCISALTDLVINGPNDVWIDLGSGMEQLSKSQINGSLRLPSLESPEDVRRFALDLARQGLARLDDASPIVDARLDKGVRLNAALEPIAGPGSGAFISLRFPARTHYSLREIAGLGMITPTQLGELTRLVKARKNIIISGSTGSGKTTLMCAMIKEVAKTERLICVEEAREIPTEIHPHLISLSARQANTEGAGEISLSTLLKSTLRMRPDRVFLGECRGDEIKEYLLALNTGHSGAITTIHANSATEAKARLEILGIMCGLSRDLVSRIYQKNIDTVVHIERIHGIRRVVEILKVEVGNQAGNIAPSHVEYTQPSRAMNTMLHPTHSPAKPSARMVSFEG